MSDSTHEPPVSEHPKTLEKGVTRRLFLKRSTAAAAGAATLGTMTALDVQPTRAHDATPVAEAMSGMAAVDRAIAFFNVHEAATVDALASRIMPGTADDPGAHEAGVVFYIDRSLSGTNLGYTRKTYTQGPFPVVQEEPVTVEAASSRDIYDFVSLPADQIARYGYQSVLTPQEIYRRGLGFVDAYAATLFQKDFVDLTTDQQDQILTDMDEGNATGFAGPSGKAFFTQLRNDTIEGMFGDPMYGGNIDLVGWKLIGYPGAQRSYAPTDIKNTTFSRAPQSLGQMMEKEGH